MVNRTAATTWRKNDTAIGCCLRTTYLSMEESRHSGKSAVYSQLPKVPWHPLADGYQFLIDKKGSKSSNSRLVACPAYIDTGMVCCLYRIFSSEGRLKLLLQHSNLNSAQGCRLSSSSIILPGLELEQ